METTNKFQAHGNIKVINGSILNPHNAGLRFVLSFNNLAGKPEGNPLLPVFDKKWKKVREESRGWFTNKTGAYKLGAINTTAVQSDVWVVHLLCQDDALKVDLRGLKNALKATAKLAKYEKATIHVSDILIKTVPELSQLLESTVISNGISVSFYQEPV